MFNNQYLIWEEYRNLGGSLELVPFNPLEFRARKIIDNLTLGRLINLENQVNEVKMCVFELINELNLSNENGSKSSESVGSYSVSYSSPNVEEEKTTIKNIVEQHLSGCKLDDGTPYMYLGVD